MAEEPSPINISSSKNKLSNISNSLSSPSSLRAIASPDISITDAILFSSVKALDGIIAIRLEK